MVISRATTPVFEFKFPEVISTYTDGIITFSQHDTKILDKELTDLVLLSGTTYKLNLTQADTNKFSEGIFECQVRLMKNNAVAASKVYRGRIVNVLNDIVLGV